MLKLNKATLRQHVALLLFLFVQLAGQNSVSIRPKIASFLFCIAILINVSNGAVKLKRGMVSNGWFWWQTL